MESRIPFGTIQTGEVSGSASAKQLPAIVGDYVNIKAVRSNTGNVYLGKSGVTAVNGTTDTTTGLELDAGEETGWLRVKSLDSFYIICDNATDDIVYMVLS